MNGIQADSEKRMTRRTNSNSLSNNRNRIKLNQISILIKRMKGMIIDDNILPLIDLQKFPDEDMPIQITNKYHASGIIPSFFFAMILSVNKDCCGKFCLVICKMEWYSERPFLV
ncbi:hypothetical protein LOAG_03688 [Loa loa]|uniref:Uncharacterized protein n=1 Tax=Loa loa TaxID=7209 RepID=A0A1S0U3W8_LOALO|nr:hypothetical protein LOAG_03688 [Loa loa]EFO24799.1 hypothetical protein LOAG_03688 [Loa loa]